MKGCCSLPRLLQVGRAGELLRQERAEEQTQHERDYEKVVKVLAEHVKGLRRKHPGEEYVQTVGEHQAGGLEATRRCGDTSDIVHEVVVVQREFVVQRNLGHVGDQVLLAVDLGHFNGTPRVDQHPRDLDQHSVLTRHNHVLCRDALLR
jgi:hypothetical protein